MASREVPITDRHIQYRNDVLSVMRNYEDLPAIEILCVLSQVVGSLIALQDQNKYTIDMVMKHVLANLELGNAEVLDKLETTQGNA